MFCFAKNVGLCVCLLRVITTQPWFLTTPIEKHFENIVGKGKTAGNQHFLFFLQRIVNVSKTEIIFCFCTTFVLSPANIFKQMANRIKFRIFIQTTKFTLHTYFTNLHISCSLLRLSSSVDDTNTTQTFVRGNLLSFFLVVLTKM